MEARQLEEHATFGHTLEDLVNSSVALSAGSIACLDFGAGQYVADEDARFGLTVQFDANAVKDEIVLNLEGGWDLITVELVDAVLLLGHKEDILAPLGDVDAITLKVGTAHVPAQSVVFAHKCFVV